MEVEIGDIPLTEWFDMLLSESTWQYPAPESSPGGEPLVQKLPRRVPGEALHHAMLDVEEGPVPYPGQGPVMSDGVLSAIRRLEAERDAARRETEVARAQVRLAVEAADQAGRYRAVLADILRLFQVDESGWARSVHVSLDDFNGWLALAEHGRTPHAA